MTNLSDLIAQRAVLEEQIKTLMSAQRAEALEHVKAMMREHGLTPADLRIDTRSVGKPESSEGKKVAIKYRDLTGNRWSGRGLKPKWLQAAIAAGKKIEDFAV